MRDATSSPEMPTDAQRDIFGLADLPWSSAVPVAARPGANGRRPRRSPRRKGRATLATDRALLARGAR
jgi:hypothetical protein